MSVTVEIDTRSGFCGGVIRAISKAEDYLDTHPDNRLYSLGSIVHNEAELERLGKKGLVSVTLDSIPSASEDPDAVVFIRAHGEPPSTYERLERFGHEVIDCTCPVVLKLQKSIREAYDRLRSSGGRIVIFGKVGHAEVLGLVGQVGGDAVVVQDMEMLKRAMSNGFIPADRPIEIFSQTTKSPIGYKEICKVLEEFNHNLTIHDTICSQVASRHAQIADFAKRHDVIVFISGKESSNGKVLYELCREANERTYHATSPEDIQASWFKDGDNVGICGATSTPKWLLEGAAEKILQIN